MLTVKPNVVTPESTPRYGLGLAESPALRTMRSTEVLDEALRTYRFLAPILLRRSAVPAVFVLASVLFWARVIGPRLLTTTSPGDTAAQVGESAFALGVGLLVAGPLLVFGMVEATVQAIALASAHREGRWKGEAAAAIEARRAFPRAFGAGLWAFVVAASVPVASFGVVYAGGLLAGVTSESDSTSGVLALVGGIGVFVGFVVALWAAAAYALAPAAALRGDGPRAACLRSRRLMKGDARIVGGFGTVWAMYGMLLIAALAEWGGIAGAKGLVPFAGAIPGTGLLGEVLSLGTPFVVAWTLLPLWGTAVAVMDAERRVRKEGYDVELLAKG